LKKKHPEHVNLERWLVSYADFITLLFAFFVVMYSMANQDKAKIKQITESIARAFSAPSSMLDMGSGRTVTPFANAATDYGHVIDTLIGRTNARPEENPELQRLAARIEESIAFQLQTTDLKDVLRVVYDDRGMVLRFSANKLFRGAEASVDRQYLPVLNQIGEVLSVGSRLIRIEGHTDDSPLPADSKFATNWELSSARAIWIVRYLRARYQIPTARLSAAGFADGLPLMPNNSEENRALNRRIEIVVTNLRYVPPRSSRVLPGINTDPPREAPSAGEPPPE
jgi:chemotaxis protein MotB